MIAVCAVLIGCSTGGPTELPALEAALSSNDSATVVLENWCRDHRLAEPASVRAERVAGEDLADSGETRHLLQVGEDEPLRYRHVRLVCGGVVMSVAHNWYVPARLAPEMNRFLDTTDTPFGRVVKPLGFTRTRLDTYHGDDAACPADTVLSQHAVLRLKDGTPFALVIECYTAANFAR